MARSHGGEQTRRAGGGSAEPPARPPTHFQMRDTSDKKYFPKGASFFRGELASRQVRVLARGAGLARREVASFLPNQPRLDEEEEDEPT